MPKTSKLEKQADEAYCKSCGKIIKKEAETCPHCGVRQKNYKRQGKDKTTAILLAVFLGFFTWLYTYKTDSWKFWVGLISSFVLCFTFVVPIGVWIWAIIDTASKNDDWYVDFD